MQRFEGLMLHVPQDQVSALREPIVWARLFGADGNSPIEEPSAAPEQGTTT